MIIERVRKTTISAVLNCMHAERYSGLNSLFIVVLFLIISSSYKRINKEGYN